MGLRFIHLHNHTEFSILDGAIKIESLIQRAKEFGMDADYYAHREWPLAAELPWQAVISNSVADAAVSGL